MVKALYIPERGDIVWLDFNPVRGHEQAGRRPALVISPQPYNRAVGLAIVCPITSQIKGYSFEVVVKGRKVQGVVLADQLKTFDWRARNARFIEKVAAPVVGEVLERVSVLLS